MIKRNNHGFAAIVTLLALMSLVLIITFSISAIIIAKKRVSKDLIASAQSYYAAESGIEDAVLRVIKGYEYTAINSFALQDAFVSQDITKNGDITAIESLSSCFNNERKIKTLLTITKDVISFHYGVQVGEGGLEMANGSAIIGNIYSNGAVNGSSSAAITGDVYVATGMTLDHSWTVYNDDRVFGESNPIVDVAQSFSPTTSGNLSQISFYIKKIGSPSDKTIRVFTDDGSALPSSGSPAKTKLASTTLVASKIGANYGWINYSFPSPPALDAGKWYWAAIDTSPNSSKYFSMGKDSNKGNGNGVSKYSSDWNAASPVWTEDSGDFDFKVWMGGQPTSLNSVIVGGTARANTIANSMICGDAYYQTIDGGSLDFLNNPSSPECAFPLTAGAAYPDSSDPAVESMPISNGNIDDWKADALAGGVYSDAARCSPGSDIVLGPAKLACDFTPGGGIKITIQGTVWVEGDINFLNNTIIELASGYGADSGVIIADKPGSETTSGKINVSNNAVICGSSGYNSDNGKCNPPNGSYLLVLSTHSGTATEAITISNNADGAIFYARSGTAGVYNNANLKEVTAYKLKLANNTTVTYESGLANTSFSSGPGAGWIINSWNEIQ